MNHSDDIAYGKNEEQKTGVSYMTLEELRTKIQQLEDGTVLNISFTEEEASYGFRYCFNPADS